MLSRSREQVSSYLMPKRKWVSDQRIWYTQSFYIRVVYSKRDRWVCKCLHRIPYTLLRREMEKVVYTLCFGWYLRCHNWIVGMRVCWSFSVSIETSILSFWDSGPSAAFCPHHPTAALLDFLPVLLSEQMCQHFVTDGCLQQWTQSLNIPHRLQEMLGAHLRDRLAAQRSTG